MIYANDLHKPIQGEINLSVIWERGEWRRIAVVSLPESMTDEEIRAAFEGCELVKDERESVDYSFLYCSLHSIHRDKTGVFAWLSYRISNGNRDKNLALEAQQTQTELALAELAELIVGGMV